MAQTFLKSRVEVAWPKRMPMKLNDRLARCRCKGLVSKGTDLQHIVHVMQSFTFPRDKGSLYRNRIGVT
eukprot:1141755-Pelagomonas_calceolata.AAC.2